MPFNIFQFKKSKCTHAICPSCKEKSTLEEWNNMAVTIYGKDSPDIRVAAVNKKVTFPFQCPNCYMAFSAYLVELV